MIDKMIGLAIFAVTIWFWWFFLNACAESRHPARDRLHQPRRKSRRTSR